jgi:hypothetical protein
VLRARERPALVELVERDVVDADDNEVVGSRLVSPDVEAGIDGVELRLAQGVGGMATTPSAVASTPTTTRSLTRKRPRPIRRLGYSLR